MLRDIKIASNLEQYWQKLQIYSTLTCMYHINIVMKNVSSKTENGVFLIIIKLYIHIIYCKTLTKEFFLHKNQQGGRKTRNKAFYPEHLMKKPKIKRFTPLE